MSKGKSSALDEHFNNTKHTLSHLEYLDRILGHINAVHIDKVMEIRNTIELTLLDNPKSKNEVVAYLSGVNEKFQAIGEVQAKRVKNETFLHIV